MKHFHDSASDVAGLLADIREARFSAGLRCVRCASPRVVRWGRFAERQRYRCRACLRTFSDLTGTPAAYAKRLALLPAYRACLEQSMSVRASARTVGVHLTTSFRWRHRYLHTMSTLEQVNLTGLVELAESCVLCTDTVRPWLRGRRRHLSDPGERRTWIAGLCDRSGRSIMLLIGQVRRAPWGEIFDDVAPAAAGFVTRDGPYSYAAVAAAGSGIPLLRVVGPQRRNPSALLLHVKNASAMIARFRRWLRQFRGVKTRYLPNYLFWFDAIDPTRRTDWRLDHLLCWPLVP